MAITLKDAIRVALDFVQEIQGDVQQRNVRVEEAERSDDGAHWLVTVGMGGPEAASSLSVVAGQGTPRIHKLLRVDAETGDVVGMQSRNA